MRVAAKEATIRNGFCACELSPWNPDAVDYSQCVVDRRVPVATSAGPAGVAVTLTEEMVNIDTRLSQGVLCREEKAELFERFWTLVSIEVAATRVQEQQRRAVGGEEGGDRRAEGGRERERRAVGAEEGGGRRAEGGREKERRGVGGKDGEDGRADGGREQERRAVGGEEGGDRRAKGGREQERTVGAEEGGGRRAEGGREQERRGVGGEGGGDWRTEGG